MTKLPGVVPGLSGNASLIVDAARTAVALGSGSVPVFGTPALIVLMEQAALDCVETLLPPGQISLGTQVNVDHVAPTAVGEAVTARAELVAVEGKTLTFALTAHEGAKLVGRGTHVRAVVDRQRFMAKVQAAG